MTAELLNTLYVQTQGAWLGLDHDTVRIQADEVVRKVPLSRLDGITVIGRVTMSAELIGRCADDGRCIVWLDRNGRFRGRLQGRTGGNVLLRRAQHLCLTDSATVLELARCMVAGKLKNSRLVLLRAARDATADEAAAELKGTASALGEALVALPGQCSLDGVRGVEGRAARSYFHALRSAVKVGSSDWEPEGRTRRPPRDRVNCLLSFVYGLLRSECASAIESVGLDPQVGYLHGLRPGRPALALDLMEEFRPILADRLVLAMVNRRQVAAGDFEEFPGGAVHLTESGRKVVITQWQRQKEHEHQHRLLDRKVAAGLLPQVQARLLARYLRGEMPVYIPFTTRS